MTPIEKAENALNRRISQLQANLRDSTSETSQRFLLQSLVVSIGIGEALTDYVKKIGKRYGIDGRKPREDNDEPVPQK